MIWQVKHTFHHDSHHEGTLMTHIHVKSFWTSPAIPSPPSPGFNPVRRDFRCSRRRKTNQRGPLRLAAEVVIGGHAADPQEALGEGQRHLERR